MKIELSESRCVPKMRGRKQRKTWRRYHHKQTAKRQNEPQYVSFTGYKLIAFQTYLRIKWSERQNPFSIRFSKQNSSKFSTCQLTLITSGPNINDRIISTTMFRLCKMSQNTELKPAVKRFRLTSTSFAGFD